jgi:glycine/serine hydroxymethyltransferase
MPIIVDLIDEALTYRDDANRLNTVTAKVHELMKQFPLY